MAWIRRLLNLTRREDLERDIDREMAFHIDEKTDELVASGMSREEAPADPLSVIGAASLLLVSSGLAGLIPARRASLIDPMAALRYE